MIVFITETFRDKKEIERMKYLCCIFNYAPHYRFPIYSLLGRDLNAQLYFGDRLYNETIKKIDYKKLKGFKKELRTQFFKIGKYIFEYTSGWFSIALNTKYDKYLITPNIYSINQWLFLIICFLLRKKVYIWMHGIKNPKLSRRALLIYKAYDFFVNGSFLYGDFAKQNMIKLGFTESKLHIIYNSLNYDETKKIRLSSELRDSPYKDSFKNENPIILFIGRLTKVKKLDMILKAYSILKDKGVFVNVVFIGDGPERAKLEESISENEKDNFLFVGELYDENVIAKYISNADICVSPGNVGLTAIHAHSYGLPVITNDDFVSQMPEFEVIQDEYTGYFFKNDDIFDLVNKISLWLERKIAKDTQKEYCYKIIDEKYNPYNQLRIFKNVLDV